jgi:hypothetical protein
VVAAGFGEVRAAAMARGEREGWEGEMEAARVVGRAMAATGGKGSHPTSQVFHACSGFFTSSTNDIDEG